MQKNIKGISAFLLLTISLPAAAEEIVYDTTQVVLREFDKGALKEFSGKSDFNYHSHEGTNAWLNKLIMDFLSRFFDKENLYSTWNVIEILIYVFAAASIIYIIVRLLRADKSLVFYKDSERSGVHMKDHEENIHELDLDQLLEEAVQQRHYRRAIRLLYLILLKELAGKKLIDWSPAKTNHEYLREIKSAPMKKTFQANTIIFEYIWYGEFPLDEAGFEKARESFQSFIQQVKTIK